MTRRYSAFMVRCWHLANGQQRYAVEDIQTGTAIRVPSLAEAFAWLAAQSRDPPDSPEARPPRAANQDCPLDEREPGN